MQRFLGSRADLIYSLLRFFSGTMFACHGAQKLFGVLGGHPMLSDPEMLAAGVIEFFGGVLIAIGLQASIAGFVASGQMAVAYFQAHAPKGFWPIENHGELAVVYCFLFLYVGARGSGAFSVDGLLKKRA